MNLKLSTVGIFRKYHKYFFILALLAFYEFFFIIVFPKEALTIYLLADIFIFLIVTAYFSYYSRVKRIAAFFKMYLTIYLFYFVMTILFYRLRSAYVDLSSTSYSSHFLSMLVGDKYEILNIFDKAFGLYVPQLEMLLGWYIGQKLAKKYRGQ